MAGVSHLRSLQALELAVRKGSLVAAAEVLAITPAAVGQRIKALEDYLGVELLLRGRAGILAAPALMAALPHLRLAFVELERAADELDLQRGQELHVSAPSDLLDLWLRPRLTGFRERYPQLRFGLNGEGDAPMRLGRPDCRIHFGPPSEGADLLFRDYVLPVGSPANKDRTAALPAATRFEGFPLLHVDFYKDDPAGMSWQHWIAANRLTRSAPERGIRFQRISAALDSVLADAGFALMGIAMLRDQLEAGCIALPYPASMGSWTHHGFSAEFRTDSAARGPLRLFREWLLDEAEATRDWMEDWIRTSGSE